MFWDTLYLIWSLFFSQTERSLSGWMRREIKIRLSKVIALRRSGYRAKEFDMPQEDRDVHLENSTSAAGTSSSKTNNVRVIRRKVAAWFLLIMSIFMLLGQVREAGKYLALKEGMRVSGVVNNTSTYRSAKTGMHYQANVTYRLADSAQSYNNILEISEAEYGTVKNGDKVTLTCSSKNPMIATWGTDISLNAQPGIFCGVFVLLAIFLFLSVRKPRTPVGQQQSGD